VLSFNISDRKKAGFFDLASTGAFVISDDCIIMMKEIFSKINVKKNKNMQY